MPPLLSKEEIYAMDSGDDPDHDLISTDMLEHFRDRIQYHKNVNRREAHYKILNIIKQR